MDRKKIEELLDKSCACALSDWVQGKEIDKQEARNAMDALREGLKEYRRPAYDSEYLPPAYVISYQLGHVYMAWEALSRLKDEMNFGTRGRNSLRIIDFGAGTSVGRIGAALMASEAIEDNRSIDRISIEEYDTSPLMLGMGNLVWEAFSKEVRRSFAGTALARAVNVIYGGRGQNTKWENVRKVDCETWLTAFHVTYTENNDLEEVIHQLYQIIDPTGGAFSCHKGNFERMRDVFPFNPVYEPPPGYYPQHEGKSGYYPQHEGKPDGCIKCSTAYIGDRAKEHGFWQGQKYRPYLQVKACAILVGPDIPF